MRKDTLIAVVLMIVTAPTPSCGPIEGPDARCEDEGGSWVCIDQPGGERCTCDRDEHAEAGQ